MIDRQHLKEYTVIREDRIGGRRYETDPVAAAALPGESVGFQRFFAAPEDDIDVVDVKLHDAPYGHTDTRASAEHNQALSEQRANAVAGVIRVARPDLQLDVQGFGETRLKVPEAGADVAADRAANRRVELRYTG